MAKKIKMEGKMEKIFYCNLKMNTLAEDLRLSLYNNS